MKENIKKNLINWSVGGTMILSSTLYSSMNFNYRLDKDISFSSVNYSSMSDVIIDALNVNENTSYYKINAIKNEYSHQKIVVNNKNEIAIYNNYNGLKLSNLNIIKKGSNQSIYNAGVLGLNSAILSDNNMNISVSYIKTFGFGAKGIYHKGEGKHCYINKVIIETLQDNSNAVEVANNSLMTINNSLIYTNGEKSGGICVSANSKMNAKNLTLYISNDNSPSIYLNGTLVIEKSLIETAGSYLGVIEGNSKLISISNSLRGYNGFKLMNKQEEDNVLITLSINKRYINVEHDELFYIEDVSSNIYLSDVSLSIKENKFITTNSEIFNTKNNINLKKVNIQGDVLTKGNSSINLNFLNSASLEGKLNGNITLNFKDEKNSSISLTETSYIDQLNFLNNNIERLKKHINFKGNILYYNKKNNSWLENKEYYFEDGGALIPA